MSKVNKKVTHNKYIGFDQMLGNSLHELFHPSSKKSLLNYSELNLVNMSELSGLVEWNQLKLVDAKQFKLLDLGMLLAFVQYVGAFTVLFLILGGFGLRLTIDQYTYSSQLSFDRTQGQSLAVLASSNGRDVEPMLAMLNTHTPALAVSDSEDHLAMVNTTENSAVLGASTVYVQEGPATVEVTAVIAKEVTPTFQRKGLCSFKNGEVVYSSGSTFSPVKSSNEVCVSAPGFVDGLKATAVGDHNQNLSLTQSGCINLNNIQDASALSVDMFDSSDLKVGSCQLVLASL